MSKKSLLFIVIVVSISFSVFGSPRRDTAKGDIHLTGPIRGGEQGWPYGAYYGNIRNIGYVEEEYFIEGNAVLYNLTGEWTTDGKWTLERGRTFPYKTRLLVHRPADSAEFNGTVIVEWANVTSGYEMAFVDIAGMPDLVDRGFAYVLASVQPISVNGFQNPQAPSREVRAVGTSMTVQAAPADLTRGGLRTWDPQRYGSLSIPNDGISYDIFTQIGIAVGPNRKTLTSGVDPMGGLTVRNLIGIGGSQSGIRILSYTNGVQPLENVYSALIPAMGSGQGVDFLEAIAADRTAPDPNPEARRIRPAMIRDDLTIPVMVFNSESEADWTFEARQPETDRFRHWEVAATSHAGPRKMQLENLKTDRDGITYSLHHIASTRQAELDWQPVLSAAFWHIHNWVNGEGPPPSFPPIAITQTNGRIEIQRDQYGNAIGGVRLPALEVPFANYSVVLRTRILPSSFTIPFSTSYLRQLYPTHDDYVAQVTEAVNRALETGVLLRIGADEYIRRARAAPVPEASYPDALRQFLR